MIGGKSTDGAVKDVKGGLFMRLCSRGLLLETGRVAAGYLIYFFRRQAAAYRALI